MTDNIHSCSYFCDLPNCIKRQRDEMRDVLAAQPAQTPQPVTQALTVQEIEQIIAQHDYEIHGDRAHYIVRLTEEIHGITANGGGNKV